jgi:hypothetical protein
MSQAKPMFQFKKKTILLSGILILSGLPLLWNMQSLKAQLVTSDDPVPPDSTPKASRGECDRPETYDTPPTLIVSTSGDSLTTNSASPRFYVYVPFALRERDPGMFTLMDESDRIVDQQEFVNFPDTSMFTMMDENERIVDQQEFLDSPDKSMFTVRDENGRIVDQQEFIDLFGSGILEISLNYQLQGGQNYEWFFETFCNDSTMSNSTDNSFSSGSSIRREVAGSSNDHFYDQLQQAADLKQQGFPGNWNAILNRIGLSHLSSEDIISP